MGTVNIVYEEKIANSYIQECVESLPSMEQTKKGLYHGEECKDFHPKMCFDSIKKGECFSENCHMLISKELKDNHQA